MERDERQRRAQIRRRRRKRQILIGYILIILLILIILGIAGVLAKDMLEKRGIQIPEVSIPWISSWMAGEEGEAVQTENVPDTESPQTQAPETEAVQTEAVTDSEEETALAEADRLAVQYDYDGAIARLQSSSVYESSTRMQEAAAGYAETKAACVEYTPEQVTHVFYHTLIYDTSKAFDGDSKEAGYDQVMTTVSEYNAITQSMYEKGYVLVSPHDMCTVNDDGTVTPKNILLPADKKPFVLSQDDVSYYHYMDGDGFATKLVLDENGQVKNEYKNDDGSVSVGDYDLVPLLDTFVAEHPDFSYHGRKGVIALTGYNGILGYRTDIAYKTGENLDEQYQAPWLAAHPDFDYDQECADAKAVADAMKANGWEFASHTWGHINVSERSVEDIKTDTEKWLNYVAPLTGDTDMIIFAFGADIGSWQNYTHENAKFDYLKSKGFSIYCNVDGSQYWVQFGSDYMRQGRRNLDGYRMYYNPDMLSDLFDVSQAWDDSRPTPVPPM
mgnify:CR=1 FL=1